MNIDEITNKYEQSLHLPVQKPERLFILCPVGLVGAGKTTVIKPLSEKLSLVRISTDDIRKLLRENGYGYKETITIAKNLSGKYLDQGYSLAIDADCAGSTAKELLSEAVDKYNPKLVWIHVNPPEKFILNKLRNFKHTWLFKNGEEAVKNYLDRKTLHAHLDMPFVYTLDTSKPDLDEQIDQTVDKIRELLH